MLSNIFAIGYSNRCKSLIKPIRTQLDVHRKGKDSAQRFLKNNLAQLIANRHYVQAYEKEKQTDEYIIELNRVSCYDFVEESCEHILKRLPDMQKRSECPEDCMEAVGTLVYAAAKFAEIYELRMLRDIFKERYGKSLERFANQEFVSNFSSKTPPTAEKKVKVLEDIASEYAIKWDSSVLEQMLANPSASGDAKDSQQKVANPKRPQQKMANPVASGDSKVSEQKKVNPSASEKQFTNPAWDSRAFEQMLADSSAAALVQPKKSGPFHYEDDTEKPSKDTETLTIIYKRMTSAKDRNEIANDKYRASVGSKDVNIPESENLEHRYVRNEDLTRKGRLSLGSEQSSPTTDKNGSTPRARGKFTQFNNELWEESAVKAVGKRAEFTNGRYRHTTIL